MSHLTDAALKVGEAVETLRRSFNRLLEESQMTDAALRQLREDIRAGLDRERQLREMLRENGLASFDGTERKESIDESSTRKNRIHVS